jgi:hypothetical protein
MLLRDCRTASDREAAIAEALRLSDGVMSDAAALLGVSRQHLHRLVGPEPATVEAGVITLTLKLPRHCVEWLDVEAVKRKYRSGSSKAAKAPIVVELIERAMAEAP